MLHVFTIHNKQDAICHFRQGVPLPKGKYSANTRVNLVNEQQELIACSSKVLGLWPDKSVRWLLLEGSAKLNAKAATRFYLQHASYNALSIKPQWVHNHQNHIQLRLKNATFTLSKTEFLLMQSEHLLSAFNFEVATLEQTSASIEHIKTSYEIAYDSLNQALFCDIEQSASLLVQSASQTSKTLKLNAKLRVYYDSGAMELQFNLHNPQPLIHHGGQWDLGNENSIYIKELALNFDIAGAQTQSVSLSAVSTLNNIQHSAQNFEHVSIVQHSSGGEFWNSPNHKGKDNLVHLQQRGASLMFESKDSNDGNAANTENTSSLDRPEPLINITSAGESLVIKPEHFWQKFPSSVHANAKQVRIGYSDAQNPTELQPGEKLSHTLLCVLQNNHTEDNLLLDSVQLALAPELVQESKIIPWFTLNFAQDPLQSLINTGIDGERNFFNKREALDEFGWRNFGDIYADHEAANHAGDAPFVSHYNNQYDPLYGFLKQWLLSGEHKWKILADDLFDHLVHIDIYHTDLDKPEYNNGLFWHTDHYLQAETASHRTYSKHQPSDVYQDHAGGGGPGAHHCYTSGLALYYWLSGNAKACECMLKLNHWMQHIYEGDRTLLGLVLNIKNANYLRMPGSNKLLLGNGTGIVRNVFTDTYPLDRGTGNYVNAILDAYELTQDLTHLENAEHVIIKTISAQDDFSQRNFADIENTWYYVVFLQSVAKYLYFVTQGDHSLATSRQNALGIQAAFLHYIDYICLHEQPYLNQKDKLEYPNDTWTAQDLRKVQLLVMGATFVEGEQKTRFVTKARELNRWIVSRLQTSEEREYTRLLTLMMQNYGAMQLLKAPLISQRNDTLSKSDASFKANEAPSLRAKTFDFVSAYSLKREIQHLRQRIPTLQKWLGRG